MEKIELMRTQVNTECKKSLRKAVNGRHQAETTVALPSMHHPPPALPESQSFSQRTRIQDRMSILQEAEA